MQKIKHIIFDFGGVIIEIKKSKLGVPAQLIEVFGISPEQADKIWNENKNDLLVGKETPKEFIIRINNMLCAGLDDDAVHKKWEGLNKTEKSFINWELVDFIEKLKEKYQIHALTDVIDFDYGNKDWFGEVEKHFKNIFRSFEIGKIKPEKETFLYVLKKIGAKPEECIFIDDVTANVDAAESLGIKSILFASLDKLIKEIDNYTEK